MSQLPRLIGVALAIAIAAPLVRAQQAEPAPAAPPPAAAAPTPAAPRLPAETPAATPAPVPDAATPPATAPAATPGAEAPATQPAAAAPADQTVQENAHNFFHYTLIARYDMADAQLQQLLGRDPKEVLPALEAEARKLEPSTSLDAFLLRKLDVPELKKDLTTLRINIEKARGLKAEDPNYIEEQIKKLAGGEREWTNALTRLRVSGEMAVPQMVAMLRDPTKMQYHPGIRWGLFNLGRPILNPLVAATDMRDNPQALIAVADVLAQIGSPDVVPYLQRLVQDKDTSQIVKSAVASALGRMGQDPRGRAAEGFYDLANKGFYYRTSGITYDNRNPTAYVWFWDAQRGFLTKKDTPPATWHDIMAMRASETALRLGTTRDAVSLWLAANNRREADTPEGQTSGVYADTPAHFWNVRLGAEYRNSVLARAERPDDAGGAEGRSQPAGDRRGQQPVQRRDEREPAADGTALPGPAGALRGGDRRRQRAAEPAVRRAGAGRSTARRGGLADRGRRGGGAGPERAGPQRDGVGPEEDLRGGRRHERQRRGGRQRPAARGGRGGDQ